MNNRAEINTARELRAWVAGANAGDVAVYFRGNLAAARDQDSELAAHGAELIRIEALALQAMDLSDKRAVRLTQERIGEEERAYLATRTGVVVVSVQDESAGA